MTPIPFVPTQEEIKALPAAMKDQLLMSLSLTYCQLLNAVQAARAASVPVAAPTPKVNSLVNDELRADWLTRERAHLAALQSVSSMMTYHDYLCLWALTLEDSNISKVCTASMTFLSDAHNPLTTAGGRNRQLTKLLQQMVRGLHYHNVMRWHLAKSQGDENCMDPANILLKDVKASGNEWRTLLQCSLHLRQTDWAQWYASMDTATRGRWLKFTNAIDTGNPVTNQIMLADARRAHDTKWRVLLNAERFQ